MELRDIAKVITDYNKLKMHSEIIRYTSLHPFRKALPELFGFPAGGKMTVDERIRDGNSKYDKIELIESLLAGEKVSDEELQNHLGFTLGQFENYMARLNPVIKPVPDKLVVMTFDDAMLDHLTIAAPVLKKFGQNATFLVAEIEFPAMNASFRDKARFMTWEQIKELNDMGFEIGNHTLTHPFAPDQEFNEEEYFKDIDGLNERCEKYGIPRPVSFGYPGGMCSAEQVDAVYKKGFLWGRGNITSGISYNNGTTIYDPLVDSPLSMPSWGDPPMYTMERFARRVSSARNGRIVILAYHGLTVNMGWSANQQPFESFMRYLYDNGYKVISMAQLGEYIDPVKAYEYANM